MNLDKFFLLIDPIALPKVIVRNRTLLWQCISRNVEVRYRGSVLGLVWSFIQPLAILCVYTFVFSWLMGAKWGIEGSDWGLGIAESKTAFAMIMLCGMTVFNLFSESLTGSCVSIIANPNYVKKVIFPLEILPFAQVLSTFLLGIAWFLILFVGTLIFFGKISITMLLTPVVLLPLLFLTLGFSYAIAALGVFLRDIQHVVGIMLQFLFWALPIVYPIKVLRDRIADVSGWFPQVILIVIEKNPLTIIVEQLRRVFLFGQLPDWAAYAGVLAVSLFCLQLGFFFFVRTKRGFADVL